MLPELEAVQQMLKYIHHQAKAQLDELDEEGLNWVPEGIEAVNSIYGLALHIASAQAAFANAVAKEKLIVDMLNLQTGSSIFKVKGSSAQTAKDLLRQAGEITNRVFDKLTPEDLEVKTVLPGGVQGTGRSWILLMLTHGGEHVGHMSLTRQLYQKKFSTAQD